MRFSIVAATLLLVSLYCIALADGWEPDYCDDFSAEPYGWTISDTSYFYWDPVNQCLHIEVPNKNMAPEFPYAYHPVDYWGGCFKVEFDLYVKHQGYDAGLWGGLKEMPCDGSFHVCEGACRVLVYYGHSDVGKHVGLVWCDDAGNGGYESHYEAGSSEGKLLHHVITYSQDDGTLSFVITESGEPYLERTFTGVGPFSPDMDCLAYHDRFRDPTTGSVESGIGCLHYYCFYNGLGPSASERGTWGCIKSLYR